MKAFIGYCVVACLAIVLVSHTTKAPQGQVSQVKNAVEKHKAALEAV